MTSPRKRNGRSNGPVGRARWWALPLGLAIAAGAVYALLSTRAPQETGIAVQREQAEPGESPHADIDEASKARLREILREAEEADR